MALVDSREHELVIGGHVTLTDEMDISRPVQFFLINPRFRMPTKLTERTLRKHSAFDDDVSRTVHAGYVTHPWSLSEEFREKSILDIRRGAETCYDMNIPNFLIHLPPTVAERDMFVSQTELIASACEDKVRIVFENIPTKPKREHIFDSESISMLHGYNSVFAEVFGERSYGFCIDTAHLFGQGRALTTRRDALQFIEDIGDLPIVMIHLNGNRASFNGGTDIHGEVASVVDFIWGDDNSGLIVLLHWAKRNSIPIILERQGAVSMASYIEEISMLLQLLPLLPR